MSQPDEKPKGDPWHAFGYVVAGVAFYGLLGWLADRWLGSRYLVAVGIVGGAALGIYLTFARFRPIQPENPEHPDHPDRTDQDQQDE